MELANIAVMAAALIARSTLVPTGFTPWLVLVALLPALPCLTGAWKVLRRCLHPARIRDTTSKT